MTDEMINLKRLSQAIEEDMTENELFELARERRYRINDLQKENAELKNHRDKLLKNSVIDLQKIDELEKELESYKALDSHYDEIEEDAKRIAEENEQLKCDLYNTDSNLQHITIEYEKENEQLKAQVEQLSNDNHVLKTSFITQQEQIEKMKCCSNCNGIKPNGMRSEKCEFCFKSKDFINWELAE